MFALSITGILGCTALCIALIVIILYFSLSQVLRLPLYRPLRIIGFYSFYLKNNRETLKSYKAYNFVRLVYIDEYIDMGVIHFTTFIKDYIVIYSLINNGRELLKSEMEEHCNVNAHAQDYN
jgi:hypothetical protein